MSCAIITGASRGIGKEIAKTLAKNGHNIVINYRSENLEITSLINEIEALGVKCLALQKDVSNFEQSKELVDLAAAEFGEIDILINNAGITKDKLIARMKEEDFDQVMKVNVNGTFNCTKHAFKYMMKQKHGAIVNMSSVVGITGNMGQANYSASKGAVNSFTKSCAQEFARYNVRVNAIAPGFIQTDMTDVLPEEVKASILKSIPLNVMGSTEDVANAVEFLVSPKAKYITGQILSVNGGMA
ncbi:MAG: 3-oxoacyl-[acyl-carrier-protein] reductase [Proteocatella sp.]